ncbi:MAG: hypothetical protein GC191_18585 [Azospirillum sp.]|nr:hypothetical protein [Azospirillum sp.]
MNDFERAKLARDFVTDVRRNSIEDLLKIRDGAELAGMLSNVCGLQPSMIPLSTLITREILVTAAGTTVDAFKSQQRRNQSAVFDFEDDELPSPNTFDKRLRYTVQDAIILGLQVVAMAEKGMSAEMAKTIAHDAPNVISQTTGLPSFSAALEWPADIWIVQRTVETGEEILLYGREAGPLAIAMEKASENPPEGTVVRLDAVNLSAIAKKVLARLATMIPTK